MSDVAIVATWVTLNETELRMLRERFERDTGIESGFISFSLMMYSSGHQITNLSEN